MIALVMALVCLGLSWSVLTNLRHAAVKAHQFHITPDEAAHSEVIEVLSRTGLYQTWDGSPFAPVLTTGPTLLAPAALAEKLTGLAGSEMGRAGSFLYFFGVLAVLFVSSFRTAARGLRGEAGEVPMGARVVVGILSCAFFEIAWRGYDSSDYYLFGVLGEGASVFFLLICLINEIEGRSAWISGAAASLAALSKPYLVLLPLALVLSWLWAVLRPEQENEDDCRPALKRLGTGLVGIAAPWLIWIGWMAARMGLGGTVRFWINYPKIMKAANGAGLPDHAPESLSAWAFETIRKVRSGIGLMKARSFLLIVLGFGAWVLRPPTRAKVLPIFALAHLAWWVFLSPGIQSRYLLPVVVSGWLAFIAAVWLPLSRAGISYLSAHKRRSIIRWDWVLACSVFAWVVAGTSMILQVSQSWKKDNESVSDCGFCRQLQLQAYWKSLPEPRPRLLSLSSDLAHDADLVLTAPHEIELRDLKNISPPERTQWVLWGEEPALGFSGMFERIKLWNCQPIYAFSHALSRPEEAGGEGFYQCQGP